jgi:hypothetical protein
MTRLTNQTTQMVESLLTSSMFFFNGDIIHHFMIGQDRTGRDGDGDTCLHSIFMAVHIFGEADGRRDRCVFDTRIMLRSVWIYLDDASSSSGKCVCVCGELETLAKPLFH